MKVRLHRCAWYFHLWPEVQIGSCDFGRYRGVSVDFLGLTLEIHF